MLVVLWVCVVYGSGSYWPPRVTLGGGDTVQRLEADKAQGVVLASEASQLYES